MSILQHCVYIPCWFHTIFSCSSWFYKLRLNCVSILIFINRESGLVFMQSTKTYIAEFSNIHVFSVFEGFRKDLYFDFVPKSISRRSISVVGLCIPLGFK